jgi:hypothetical protein
MNVINKEDFVEEEPQEAPYSHIEDDEAVENFVAFPQEKTLIVEN